MRIFFPKKKKLSCSFYFKSTKQRDTYVRSFNHFLNPSHLTFFYILIKSGWSVSGGLVIMEKFNQVKGITEDLDY